MDYKQLNASLILTVMASLTACQASNENETHSSQPKEALLSQTEWELLNSKVSEKFLEADRCIETNSCERTTMRYKPAILPAADANAPVVLILDSGPQITAGLTRASRILGIYKTNEQGLIIQQTPEYTLDRQAIDIARLIDVPERIMPPQRLNQIAEEYHRRFYQRGLSQYSFGHLNTVTNLLVANAPNAYFVVVDSSSVNQGGADNLCDMGRQARSRLRARYQALAGQIRDIALTHKVSLINYSVGFSKDQLTMNGWFNCPNTPSDAAINDYLSITNDFVTSLAAIPNSVLVQAGVEGVRHLTVNDTTAPSDCESKPGRIRAGYASFIDAAIGPFGQAITGSDSNQLLSATQMKAEPCIDLFVNFGLKAAETDDEYQSNDYVVRSARGGIGAFARRSLDPTTSWAAPLLTAHLLYLAEEFEKTEHRRPNANELLRIANGGNPTQKIIDPLRYGQIPLARFDGVVNQTQDR